MPLIQNTSNWYEDIMPLTDGLVTFRPPEESQPGAAQALDWFYEVRKELRKIPGRLRRGTLSGAVRGMFFWDRQTTMPTMIVHTLDQVYLTTDFISFSSIKPGLIGTKRDMPSYSAVTLPGVDKLLFTDLKDVPFETDGTSGGTVPLTLPTGVTNARFVRFFKARTLLIDVIESGNREGMRIWYCVTDQYNDWTTVDGAGNIDYTEGGGRIVQVIEFNDTLVLFKLRRLAVLNVTGDATIPFRLQDFPEAPGTVFPNSVCVSPRGALYLAQDGVRLFNGQRSVLVSSQVGFDISAVAADQRDAVQGCWDQRLQRYLICLPTPGTTDNNTIWEFHFTTPEAQIIHQGQLYKRSQACSYLSFFHRTAPLTFATLPVSFQQIPGAFDDPVLAAAFPTLVSGDYAGGVFEHELTTDDDGFARTAYAELGPYPKDPVITAQVGKVLSEIRLRGRAVANTNVTVKIRPNHSQTWKTLPQTAGFSEPGYNDRETLLLSADGIEGEQFFIRLEDNGQYSWPRMYSMTLYGTHSGTFRRPG
jgi:hypothetical protein